MDDSVESSINSMALGFLFFADLFWPFFVPLAAAFVEENRKKRQVFLFFSFFGGLFGLSLFLPLLFEPDWLSVQIKQGSILYKLVQIYDKIIPQPGVRIIYVIIVATPLLASSAINFVLWDYFCCFRLSSVHYYFRMLLYPFGAFLPPSSHSIFYG